MNSLYEPPKLVKKLFPKFIWSSSIDKVLLTFDDAPHPETTPQLLKFLSDNSIKAVFFLVGKDAEQNPSLIKEISDEGHILGNHTFSHKPIILRGKQFIQFELQRTNELIEENFGDGVDFFRPPYGQFDFRTSKITEKYGLKTVMWSLLTFDYKNDLNIVKFAIENYLNKNSLVVLHDSLQSKEIIQPSLDFILDQCKLKGFEIGEPTECLKYSF